MQDLGEVKLDESVASLLKPSRRAGPFAPFIFWSMDSGWVSLLRRDGIILLASDEVVAGGAVAE
ncbi:hypothetical protein [Bradyrhizobium sp. USDA 4486]